MGPGLVLVFWLIAAGAYSAVFLFFAGVTFVAWQKKWRWLSFLAGIPAALMLGFALLFAGLMVYGIVDSMNPKSVYENALGKKVTPDIDELQSDVYWFADTGSIHLKVRCSEERFRSLIPDRLKAAPPEELSGMGEGDHLSWWDLKTDASNWIYYSRSHGHSDEVENRAFASEAELMAYNPATGYAYYSFLGID